MIDIWDKIILFWLYKQLNGLFRIMWTSSNSPSVCRYYFKCERSFEAIYSIEIFHHFMLNRHQVSCNHPCEGVLNVILISRLLCGGGDGDGEGDGDGDGDGD